MAAVLEPTSPEPTAARTPPRLQRSGTGARLVSLVAAMVTVALVVARRSSPLPAVEVVSALVAVAFAAGGVLLALRRPDAWACYWLSAIGVALAASIGGAGAAVAAALALGAVLLVTATDGHVPRRWQQIVVAAILGVGAVVALVESSHTGLRRGPLLVEGAVFVGVGLLGFAARCRAASPLERARLQWLGWSLVVAEDYDAQGKLWKLREGFVIPVHETGSCDNPAFVQYNLIDNRYLVDQSSLAGGKDMRWFVEANDPKLKESYYTADNLRAISDR